MPIIEAEGIAKSFRLPSVHRQTVREHVFGVLRRRRFEELRVLDGVSFSVEAGQAVGIMGRNGSGKSTLMKILAGIFRADRGVLRVGAPVTALLELGLGWNPELDAIDNIFLLGGVMGLSLAEIRTRIDAILAFAELERFAKLPLKRYSSGMGARLAYAVAFEAVREILILDEIFEVGDAAFRLRCRDRCHGLHKAGHTVLLVSHSAGQVADFCDRALLIEGGRVALDGDPRAVGEAYMQMLVPAQAPPP